MPDKRGTILNITKAVVSVSLKTLAAAMGANNNVLGAALTTFFAEGLNASDTIGAHLSNSNVHQEEIVELSEPSWWSNTRDWQNFCAEFKTHMPHILQKMDELLQQEQQVITTHVVQQAFVRAVQDEPLTWAFGEDRRKAAEWIASPVIRGLDAVLEPLIERRQAEQNTELLRNIHTGMGTIQEEIRELRADDIMHDEQGQLHDQTLSPPPTDKETQAQTQPEEEQLPQPQIKADAQDTSVEVFVPAPFPPIWNVPYRFNPLFADRTDLLKRLHDRFRLGSEKVVIRPQAVSGQGGIGKTHIATEYAFRYRRDYDVILWLNAESRDILLTQYVALADELNLPQKSAQNQNLTRVAVTHWFTEHTRWLLILDNADDLNMVHEFVPTTGRGHILLTSRAHAVSFLARRIEIEPMQADEGALFLLRRATLLDEDLSLEHASKQDRRDAEVLVYEMGGLPLALDQVGAYIEETECGTSGYLEVYKTHAKELLNERGEVISDHPDPVATTWTLAFTRTNEKRAAAELLRLCAFLHPDNIPYEIILQAVVSHEAGLRPIVADLFELDAAARELNRSSLIQRNPETRTITIHRLVQAALKNWIDKESQHQWADIAVRAVHHIFPDGASASWQNCQHYLPHVFVCKALIEEWNLSFVEAAQLLYRAGFYLHQRMQYDQAEQLYQRSIEIYEQSLGKEHSDVATVLEQYANLLRKTQREAEAISLEQRAQLIRAKQVSELVTENDEKY